jgi:signal transduction histidine kinase
MEDRFHYVAMVAHELRGPLLPILNAASVLKRRPVDTDVVYRCASIIERQARALNRRVDDLLDVSRLQHGNFPLMRTRVSVLEIVQQSVEMVAPVASQCGVSMTVTLACEPIDLDADAGRLVQALQNVLANAVKFSEKGHDIHVRAQRDKDDVIVTVSDAGIGLEEKDLESIFSLFAKIDPVDTARADGGLGIGLYLARKYAVAHGGTLTATSPGLGQGSVFTLRLPTLSPSAPALGDPQPTPSSRSVSFFTTA